MSQRALLFGLLTHALWSDPDKKRTLSAAFATLPRVRTRLSDDDFLNLRSDDFRLTLRGALEDDIRAMDKTLTARAPSAIFVQMWHRRLAALNQRLQRKMPWLYPERFFDFIPYDFVLSLLPPLDPRRVSPVFEGAQVYAGSNIGTGNGCFFIPTHDRITLNVWAEPAVRARFGELAGAAEALGIATSSLDAPTGEGGGG